LFLFVVKLREQLRNAGETHPDRKASHVAREKFQIPSYDIYKRRLSKGRALARTLGISD